MAGLLAWAADVVGGHGGNHSNGDDDAARIPIIFTAEQQQYVQELDQKAASLSRLIQDLRLRLPPPHISQRLPHLHAHSLASNAALALQLNSHSSTREQAQLREETLQQENAAYEKAILDCENKICEKIQEADSLWTKLKEMDDSENGLKAELEDAQTTLSQSGISVETMVQSMKKSEAETGTEASKSAILEKLETKRKELSLMEAKVQDVEKQWATIQEKAFKQPSPAQREKALDKQLHGLIEQLAAKQAQAEGLVSEIHLKEKELEKLNGLLRKFESSNADGNTARNRFGKSNSDMGSTLDYSVDTQQRLPYFSGGRNENHQRLMLFRSGFVLYILALHILVFIRISFCD